DFDHDVADQIGGMDALPLRELAALGLLEEAWDLRRYRLHSLARTFARARLSSTERAIAEGWLALWTAWQRRDPQGCPLPSRASCRFTRIVAGAWQSSGARARATGSKFWISRKACAAGRCHSRAAAAATTASRCRATARSRPTG